MMDAHDPVSRTERIDHFLRLLVGVADRFEWRVDRWGQIRAEHVEAEIKLCPITALAFAEGAEPTPLADVHLLADAIGLGDIAIDIVQSADLTGNIVDGVRVGMGLRVRMMRAIGLVG
jgi:hypothetical protein